MKMQKSTDSRVDKINAEMEKSHREESKEMAGMKVEIEKQGGVIKANGESVKRLGEHVSKQDKEVQQMKGEFVKEKQDMKQAQNQIKKINDQIDHLVLDTAILLIYNKASSTSRIYQFGDDSTSRLGSTKSPAIERNQMWRLELDPSGSGCYRIFNMHYIKWRITLWPFLLGVYASEYCSDQLWRLQYNGNGYYYIESCRYTDKRIHLETDGKTVAKNGKYDQRQLWKLVPVKQQDLVKDMNRDIKDIQTAAIDNHNLIQTVENLQKKDDSRLSIVAEKVSKDEEATKYNEAFLQKIRKVIDLQSVEYGNITEELSKESENMLIAQDDIRNTKDQIKRLVLDSKIVLITNKMNTSLKLYQFGDDYANIGCTHNPVIERNQMWRLELDPSSSGCYRIFNMHYEKWRITAWPSRLFVYNGDYYSDQTWELQYKGNGYYYIKNCGYSHERIHLKEDGTPVVRRQI